MISVLRYRELSPKYLDLPYRMALDLGGSFGGGEGGGHLVTK